MAISIIGAKYRDRNTIDPLRAATATAAAVPAVTGGTGLVLIDSATTGGVQPVGQSGWTLKFSEEFTGSTVTTTDAPNGRIKFRSDGPIWSAWYSANLTGSGDVQHSNNPGREKEYYDLPQLTLAGSNLVLTAVHDLAHNGIGLPYTSGFAATDTAYSFLFGYVEARIRCSGVGGTWPAFWLGAVDYTWPPEIDIVEQFGTDTNTRTTTYLNTGGGSTGSLQLASSGVNIVSGFHVLGMKWTSTALTFYVDGTQYGIETNTACISQKALYVLLNLAVDGNQTINSGAFPTTFLVDYLRVWQ